MYSGFRQYPVEAIAFREGHMHLVPRRHGERAGRPPPSGWRVRWPLWRVAVAERSMEPALRPGDWLLVRRAMRAGRPPRIRPGQIVIARHPGEPGLLLVKRAAWRERAGWWLESDNPGAGAVDSRSFGIVRAGLIEGRVMLRYRRSSGRR